MKDVVVILKKIMEERAISQRDLARTSGVDKFKVNRWFAQDADPKWRDIVAVSRALRLPLEYLATGEYRYYRLRETPIQVLIDIALTLTRDQVSEAVGMLRLQFRTVNNVPTPPVEHEHSDSDSETT